MVRVNIDILGISELKWTGMGEFSLYDHYIIYYCGQESLRRNGVVLIVHKRVQFAALGTVSKQQNDLCSFPRQTTHITVIKVYAPTINAEDSELNGSMKTYKNF